LYTYNNATAPLSSLLLLYHDRQLIKETDE
jgi:hypothetical protein